MEKEIEDFKDKYRKIVGLNKLHGLINDFCYWYRLYYINSFNSYIKYDYEEWKNIRYIEIEWLSIDKDFSVTMKCSNVINFSISGGEHVSGFDIECNVSRGFEKSSSFTLYDFEEGAIHLECEKIEIISCEYIN